MVDCNAMQRAVNLDEDTKSFKSHLLVHNKDKSTYRYIAPNSSYYRTAVKEIAANGVAGTHGYFYAFRDGDRLFVNFKRILVPEAW